MSQGLERFITKQEEWFNTALTEIRRGLKESHWMWFIFPQLKELGRSQTAQYYGIDGIEEARRYMDNAYLRDNLLTISNVLLEHKGKDIVYIMGDIDALKLRSCMTLFSYVSEERVFTDVLDAFYSERRDALTLKLLGKP